MQRLCGNLSFFNCNKQKERAPSKLHKYVGSIYASGRCASQFLPNAANLGNGFLFCLKQTLTITKDLIFNMLMLVSDITRIFNLRFVAENALR